MHELGGQAMDKPLQSCDDELYEFLKTTNAFKQYESFAMNEFVEYRRARVEKLPLDQLSIYNALLIPHLDAIADKIHKNSKFCQLVAAIGYDWAQEMGATPEMNSHYDLVGTTESDKERVFSTMRQIAREWSQLGQKERAESFGLIYRELDLRFPRESRPNIKVLCPGCGIGRLAFDIALMGFDSTANEFSAYMLFASKAIMSTCIEPNAITIYPFVHTFSGNRCQDAQLIPVSFPDISPHLLVDNGGELSFATGDFIESTLRLDKQNVIVTCFFLDATANIAETIKSISSLVDLGGLWINFGPLLWHYEHVRSDNDNDEHVGGLELDYDSIYKLMEMWGWKVEKRSCHKTTYCSSPDAMLQHLYECEFFVATRVSKL